MHNEGIAKFKLMNNEKLTMNNEEVRRGFRCGKILQRRAIAVAGLPNFEICNSPSFTRVLPHAL